MSERDGEVVSNRGREGQLTSHCEETFNQEQRQKRAQDKQTNANFQVKKKTDFELKRDT